MRQENNNFGFNLLYISFLLILLLNNTLVRTQFSNVSSYGEWSLSLTFIMMFGLLLSGFLLRVDYEVPLQRIYLTFLFTILVFCISFINSDYMNGLEFVQLLLLFFFILGAVRFRWKKEYLRIAGYVFGASIVFFFIHWVLTGFEIQLFKSIYRNENYLAILLFCILFFNVLSIKYGNKIEQFFFIIVTLMNIFLIITTGARSVFIAIIVTILGWVVLKQLPKLFNKLFYIVMGANLAFVFLYVGLSYTAFGKWLNQLSYSMFNKNLFSGRHEIWQEIMTVLIKKPLFGYGVGVQARDVVETNLTAHNMYLQLLLEVGLVGFILFTLLLLSIWQVLTKSLNHYVAKWSACFMLGILVYNTFELTLLQNNYSIAVFQWIIMTMGIGFPNRLGGYKTLNR